MKIRPEDALDYHSSEPAGKVSTIPTKPCRTQRDLSLAYSPGVAIPCLEIEKEPNLAYKYTSKGNLVAVISNGTAVLGLGNIGALAGKPVMEGKGVLFKRFGDIDVFDIELASEDPKEIIRACQLMEPTFGGINLEDIKAPECFEIEQELRRTMNIPVFHDDQHGTAIISGAALINALEIVGKKIDEVKVVFNGAGASGISCARHYMNLGVKLENILMCDTKGVLYEGRTEGMNKYKAMFAAKTDRRTLGDALVDADVFFGLSSANCVTAEMLKGMARDPIIFAMANPDPEIAYDLAVATRPDAIVATGRSDYPNQVNNVLGFPFIFRGALDVRATQINEEMKLAATRALAALTKEDVPDSVLRAYGLERLEFGREYIIPKPFDSRVLIWEASAVAKAAMDTGVARTPVNLDEYRESLERRLGKAHEVMRSMIHKAQRQPKRIVFAEGEENKILRACQILLDERIANPILLGRESVIRQRAEELRLPLTGIQVVDPKKFPRFAEYAEEFYGLRQRKGVTRHEAELSMANPVTFGSMMVRLNDADALIGGLTTHYPDTIRPALEVIDVRPELRRVAGVYVLITPKGRHLLPGRRHRQYRPHGRGSGQRSPLWRRKRRGASTRNRAWPCSRSRISGARAIRLAEKVRRAVSLVRQRAPGLMVDGEMQADTAVVPSILERDVPVQHAQGRGQRAGLPQPGVGVTSLINCCSGSADAS